MSRQGFTEGYWTQDISGLHDWRGCLEIILINLFNDNLALGSLLDNFGNLSKRRNPSRQCFLLPHHLLAA